MEKPKERGQKDWGFFFFFFGMASLFQFQIEQPMEFKAVTKDNSGPNLTNDNDN